MRCITGTHRDRCRRARSHAGRARRTRVFGEQLGPGRSSRAMAIVHIAIFDAVNAIARRYRSYTGIPDAALGASMDAAIAQAAHDTLVALFPSQTAALRRSCSPRISPGSPDGRAKSERHRRSGSARPRPSSRCAPTTARTHAEPRVGVDYVTERSAGQVAAGPDQPAPARARRALGRGAAVRARARATSSASPPPPALTSRGVRRGVQRGEAPRRRRRHDADRAHRRSRRSIGIYWAYDGTPSLCAPPRLYNQIAMQIADQMGTRRRRAGAAAGARQRRDGRRRHRDLGVEVSTTSSGARSPAFASPTRAPVRPAAATAIRDTVGDPTFTPLGAPASNLHGPELHAAVPRLSVGPRRLRRRAVPDAAQLLRHRRHPLHVRRPTSSTA